MTFKYYCLIFVRANSHHMKINWRHEVEEEVRPASEVKPLFCVIPKFGETVRRFPGYDGRQYFTVEQGVKLYSGLTSYIDKFYSSKLEDKKALDAYKMKMGNSFEDEFGYAASFGSFLHILCAELITAGVVDTTHRGDILNEFTQYCIRTGLPMNRFGSYWRRLNNDIMAFGQFLLDKEVEPLACEFPVYDKERGVATPLDLICRLKFNGKKYVSNVNFKFRANSALYSKDEKQTCIERMIFNQKFAGTEFEIQKTFIFTPKDWRGDTATYDLFNTTDKYTAQDWEKDHSTVALYNANYINGNEKFATKAGSVITVGQGINPNNETVEDFCRSFIK